MSSNPLRRLWQNIVESPPFRGPDSSGPSGHSPSSSSSSLSHSQVSRDAEIAKQTSVWESELIPNFDKLLIASRGCKRLRFEARKGVPPRLRSSVWAKAIGNPLGISDELYAVLAHRGMTVLGKLSAMKTRQTERAGHGVSNADESGITAEEPKESSGNFECSIPESEESENEKMDVANVSGSLHNIELDLERTFPVLQFFQCGEPMHDSLFRILASFCILRPDMGYVQGMSYLAATLLLNLDEQAAFTVLCTLLHSEHSHLRHLFAMHEAIFDAYDQAFCVIMKSYLRPLYDSFERLGISVRVFLVDWLMTVYTRSFSIDFACRVWDAWLVELGCTTEGNLVGVSGTPLNRTRVKRKSMEKLRHSFKVISSSFRNKPSCTEDGSDATHAGRSPTAATAMSDSHCRCDSSSEFQGDLHDGHVGVLDQDSSDGSDSDVSDSEDPHGVISQDPASSAASSTACAAEDCSACGAKQAFSNLPKDPSHHTTGSHYSSVMRIDAPRKIPFMSLAPSTTILIRIAISILSQHPPNVVGPDAGLDDLMIWVSSIKEGSIDEDRVWRDIEDYKVSRREWKRALAKQGGLFRVAANHGVV
eukprot:ANDGO_03191.mRNA.1 Drainin